MKVARRVPAGAAPGRLSTAPERPRSNQVALAWNTSPGAASYRVKRSTIRGGPYITISASSPLTTYTDRGLTNGMTYYYIVSAMNGGGESPDTGEVNAIPNGPPAAPTGLTAGAAGPKVILRWMQSARPGITRNRIYRSTTGGGPYTRITEISAATTYSDAAVRRGTTYYYRVTAVNSSGPESAYSNEASARPR